jgi:hypothetical protein
VATPAVFAAALWVCGCAGLNVHLGRGPRPVSLAEFSGDPAVMGRDEARIDPVAPAPPAPAAPTEATAPASDRAQPAPDQPPAPGASAAQPAVPGGRGLDEPGTVLVVDSLVGEINGRPIYADQFFTPIEDRLRAAAARSSRSAFEREAAEVIAGTLRQVALNELFLAEAEASLTAEQQQGLLAWLRELEISKGGGTRTGAESRLNQQLGVGLEERVGELRDQQLIRYLWNERIESRVIVSWWDVLREYRRRSGEFNPPASATLGRIRLTDAEQVASTTRAFAEGRGFSDVATGLGMPDGGRWQTFKLGPEGLAGIELAEPIRRHVQGLAVGETAGPFAVGNSTWWLHLIELSAPSALGVYDPAIQHRLHLEVQNRRRVQEQVRLIQSLTSGDIDQRLALMARRLLEIAVARYGPP